MITGNIGESNLILQKHLVFETLLEYVFFKKKYYYWVKVWFGALV